MNLLSLFNTESCFQFSLNSSFSNTKTPKPNLRARFPTNTPLITPIAHISRTFGNTRENRLLLGYGQRPVRAMSTARCAYATSSRDFRSSAVHHQQPCLMSRRGRSSNLRMPSVIRWLMLTFKLCNTNFKIIHFLRKARKLR